MEELYVPLLLDLQMLETTYVFEPKTIQRMELLVMATLKWRLRSVTPFDYLHYFISMLPSSASKPDSASTLQYSVASNIILNTTRGNPLNNRSYYPIFVLMVYPLIVEVYDLCNSVVNEYQW